MTLSFALALLSLLYFIGVFAWGLHRSSAETEAKRNSSEWRMSDYGFDQMPDAIKWALHYCVDRGHITVKAQGGPYAIRYIKYIPNEGPGGIELAYPIADWSTPLLPRLRAALTADGIRFRENSRPLGNTWLRIDCGQDVEKAVDLAGRCFFDIFGLPADTRFETKPKRLYFVRDNSSAQTWPETTSLSDLSEYWEDIQDRNREMGHTLPPLALLKGAMVFGLGMFVCHPVLLVTFLLAGGAAPDWQIPAAGMQGHWNTTILCAIYGVLYVGARRTFRRMRQYRKKPLPGAWTRAFGSFTLIAPVAAVILSWFGM
jgi:hypothetical protein